LLSTTSIDGIKDKVRQKDQGANIKVKTRVFIGWRFQLKIHFNLRIVIVRYKFKRIKEVPAKFNIEGFNNV